MKNIFLSLVVMISFISCAAPLKQSELKKVKQVAFINSFPQKPNYTIIGTTVFNNDYDKIESSEFYNHLSSVARDYLVSRGFKVKQLSKTDKNVNASDMVIEFVPDGIYQHVGAFGYGVYQKSFFKKALRPETYVSVRLNIYIFGKDKDSHHNSIKITYLDIDKLLPKKYDMLTNSEKDIINRSLDKNIKDAVIELLKKAGI